MNTDFRQRVFLPIVMPLGVAAAFIGFAFALSRVLLAVPEFASTAIALGVAAYILLIAAIVSAKNRITSRALAVGVTLGLVAIAGSGVIAAAAGPRALHEEETLAEGDQAEGDGEQAAAPGTFVAIDIEWESAPESLPAGETELTLVNEGAAPHTIAFEGVNGDEPVAEAQGGETTTGTVTLDPGSYTFYCTVPGHRPTMQGDIVVE